MVKLTDLGTMTVRPASPPDEGSTGDSCRDTYSWRPLPAVAADLPPDFVFELQCIQRSNGERVFSPPHTGGNTLMQGCLGGLALLGHIKTLTSEQRQSYRLMHFLFQAVQTRREYQRRRFQHARDLYVRLNSREDAGTRSVLPPDVGLGQNRQGRPWSIAELMEHGQEAAQPAGLVRPTKSARISWGLFAAAQLNPLVIPQDQVPGLIRLALFERGTPDLEPVAREQIEHRVTAAVHQHLDVASNEEFMNWLGGARSSFVKQIAKQKRSPGGVIPVATVRDVLLDLGWQAWQSMADCFHTQAWVFRQMIAPGLTPSEQRRFDLLYLKQPAFGDLPLLLIRERIPEIRPALTRLLETGDDSLIPVLHRLLAYYQYMASERRRSDQRGQALSRARSQGLLSWPPLSFREELGTGNLRAERDRDE